MSTTPTGRGRRRPQEFLLPDGRRILVALPDDADALRRKYASVAPGGLGADPAAVQVEVVLHGSDEHRAYLEESRTHHERRRAELRDRHGAAFDEWEDVHAQLDGVAAQLERLADTASMLGANFSKFGYDARLRTYDAGENDGNGSPGEGGEGGASTPSGLATPKRKSSTPLDRSLSEGGMSTMSDWEDRHGGETIKLFKRPVVKQYFHKGLLWRASGETEVMCFELFFDLLYGEFFFFLF